MTALSPGSDANIGDAAALRTDRRRFLGWLCALGGSAAAAAARAAPHEGAAVQPASAPKSGAESNVWQGVALNTRKKPTVYTATGAGEALRIDALAEGSASLFLHPAATDLRQTPYLWWRWRLRVQPVAPDITLAGREDSAARVVLCFDGDRKRLSRAERMTLALADRLAGRAMPFATLMYVAAPGLPVGTLVPSPYTRRVQMIVVDDVPATPDGGWRRFRRDVLADYRRAWGELPGPLTAYGVMTDSDNTGSRAEAVYAGLRFLPGG